MTISIGNEDYPTTDDSIKVVYNHNFVLITLGDQGVELTRSEAEKLFVDLGHALQDQDVKKDFG